MKNNLHISNLLKIVNGQLIGNHSNNLIIKGTCSLINYLPHHVTFVKNKKHIQELDGLKGAIVLITKEFSNLSEVYPQNLYIVVDDTAKAMMVLQNMFYTDKVGSEDDIDYSNNQVRTFGGDVCVGPNVYIGKHVSIGPSTKIMSNSTVYDNVIIGEKTIIEPNVTIYRGTSIGDNCIIHSGARIGPPGFRFSQDMQQGTVYKMIHVGYVKIGDRVEIGCNTVVARSTFKNSPTIISDDVKISSQVLIAHNAEVGARTIIAAMTCIAGSAKIGDDVWIGAGVTVSNEVIVGNGAKILLNAVVAYDIKDKEIVSGFYAMPHRKWKRAYQKLLEFGTEL